MVSGKFRTRSEYFTNVTKGDGHPSRSRAIAHRATAGAHSFPDSRENSSDKDSNPWVRQSSGRAGYFYAKPGQSRCSFIMKAEGPTSSNPAHAHTHQHKRDKRLRQCSLQGARAACRAVALCEGWSRPQAEYIAKGEPFRKCGSRIMACGRDARAP